MHTSHRAAIGVFLFLAASAASTQAFGFHQPFGAHGLHPHFQHPFGGALGHNPHFQRMFQHRVHPTATTSRTNEGGWQLTISAPGLRRGQWQVWRDADILRVREGGVGAAGLFRGNYEIPAGTNVQKIKSWWQPARDRHGSQQLVIDLPPLATAETAAAANAAAAEDKIDGAACKAHETEHPTAAAASRGTPAAAAASHAEVEREAELLKRAAGLREAEWQRQQAHLQAKQYHERQLLMEQQAVEQARDAELRAQREQQQEQERMEQEAVWEAIAELREGREEPGVREEWSSTEHLNQRYDVGRRRRASQPQRSVDASSPPDKPANDHPATKTSEAEEEASLRHKDSLDLDLDPLAPFRIGTTPRHPRHASRARF